MQREILRELNIETTTEENYLAFEETFLSEELLRKAELELNETEGNKKKCLQDLRDLIANEKDLEANTEDQFLLRYLRARKFDTRRAFNLLKNYYSIRNKHSDLYKDFKPSTVVNVLGMNNFGFLPQRNADGCAININRPGSWDPEVCSYDDLHRCCLMSLDKIAENEITQICGAVSICDLTGLSMKHLFQFTPIRAYVFVTAVQDCFPLRFKNLHIINHPKIFSLAYSLVKLFLSEKMKKRIILHESDTASLHRYFPPSLLPQELGGDLGPFDNSRFTKILLDSEETFVKNQMFGFVTNTKKL